MSGGDEQEHELTWTGYFFRCTCGNYLLARDIDDAKAEMNVHKALRAPEAAENIPGNIPAGALEFTDDWLQARLTEARKQALLDAAEAMPIDTLLGADKASVWLRERATRE